MTTTWTFTFDCNDVPVMAGFWRLALGYVDSPPPDGWNSWEDWLRDLEVPEDEWDDGAGLADPDGALPSMSILKVPEGKSAKNRLHIDLHVSGGRRVDADVRRRRIEAKVTELIAAGGSVLERLELLGALDHVVMADPEGNEFCVV